MKPNSPIASEGVLVLDDQGQIVLTNAHHLFNYREGELLRLPAEKIIPGWLSFMHRGASTISTLQKKTSASAQNQLHGIRKNGEEFPLEIRFGHLRKHHDFLTVAFLSEVLTAPAPQEKVDERKTASYLHLILDSSLNISLINHYGCQLLGCSESTLHGMNWLNHFIPVEDRPTLKTILDKAFTQGTSEEFKSPLLNYKGDQLIMRWTIDLIYDLSGTALGALCSGVAMGMKPDRQIDKEHVKKIKKLNKELKLNAEQQTQELVRLLTDVENINKDLQLQIQKRKDIEQKLIKFQRLYDTMVHNFPDGVIGVLNRKMEYVLIDGKDLNEIDLPALGLNGQKTSESQDPVTAEETLSKIKKAFNGESISFEVKTKDRFYHISAVPLPDAQNTVNEILCVLKNVTEKNRMEEGLLKALEKERELGELKSRFVTMACHEFKTPLATILSSTFLLENYTGESFEEEKLVHTNRIRRSVNNLTLILNEFLLLESLEENTIKPVSTSINLPKYILELLAEAEPEERKGLLFDYKHEGSQQTVHLDQHMLWSIINNLISNAVKYSGKSDKILLTSEIKNSMVTITVKDHGIGIPADEHKNIFGRFFRARNAMNFEGTGLGLYIVYKNVKLFNGNISFKSQLNMGTEFTVVLPYPTNVNETSIN